MVLNVKEVNIYTDGACSGNPGPGGWGAILRYNSYQKEISGCDVHTTNNKMELTAVIQALKLLKEPCIVNLYSDSKYVCDGLSLNWARNWKKNGWKKKNGSPALNSDLWEELLELDDTHKIKVNWLKGHAGHPENERCDFLATEAIKRLSC